MLRGYKEAYERFEAEGHLDNPAFIATLRDIHKNAERQLEALQQHYATHPKTEE